jgi:hypothetical protein
MFLFTQQPNLLWYTLGLLSHEYRRLFPGGKETGSMKQITYIHLKVTCICCHTTEPTTTMYFN